MSNTDTMSVYFKVKGAKEAEKDLKQLGQKGQLALSDITASAKPVNSALLSINSTIGQVNKTFSTFSGLAGAYLGFQGIQGTISGIVDTNTEFQKLAASLEVVEKSSESANEVLNKLDNLAVQTPYSVQALTEAWIKLGNLGLKPSEEALLSYGNTASAMGKDIMQFIEAIADASTFEFERLKEFGIKASQQNDEVAFTFQGTTTTIKKNAADIEKYLRGLGNNQFAGAMDKQMATLAGSTSNLSDTFMRFQRQVGESGFNESLQGLYGSISDVVASSEDSAKSLGSALASVTDGITTVVDNIDVLKDGAIAFGGFKLLQVGAAATTTAMASTTLATRNMAIALSASSAIAGRAATAQIAAMTAMGAAARGLSSAMALVGGLPGLIAIAGFSVYQFTKETDSAAEVASKYATELEEVKKNTEGLITATDELTNSTSKAKKIVLLEQLETIKEDMAEVQKELLDGSYWSNNWLTNVFEKFVKDDTLEHFFNQYEEGSITLDELHTKIIKLGELQPEYRDEALKFDKRYESLQALELAAEKTQNKLNNLDNPKPIETKTKQTITTENNITVNDDLKSKETLDSLIDKANKANSSVAKLESSMNICLDNDSWIVGALDGLDELSNKTADYATFAKESILNAAQSMEDSLVGFVTTGKLEFDNLASSMIEDMLRIQIQQNITQPLATAGSSWFSSIFSSSVSAGVNHTGGVIGSSGVSRSVPMGLFANAPRYHSGGTIRQDEVPIIAQKGEVILSRQTVNSMQESSSQATAPIITINIENNTNSEVTATASENTNGPGVDIIIAEMVQNKIANDVSRNRGALNSVLNTKFKS